MADDDVVTVDLDKVEEIERQNAEKAGLEPPKQDQLDESLDTLRAKLQQADNARRAAEQRAAQAERGLSEARGTVHQQAVEEITNTIDMLERENVTIKAQLRAAQEAQEWDAANDLQEKFVGNRTDIHNLKARKIQIENQPPPQPQPQGPQRTGDAAEDLARFMDANGAPNSAQWVRSHPQFARDPTLYRRMLAAHNLAETDGLTADTPEYFAYVERTLGVGGSDARPREANGRFASPEQPMSAGAQPTGGRQPSAAPPSRGGTGSGGSAGSRQVTLTREEVETAKANKQTPEEYYAAKMQLIREGKISPTRH